MRRRRTRTALFLLAVAGVLGLLVGLVRSVDRAAPDDVVLLPASVEPRVAERNVVLRMPVVLPPLAEEPPARPAPAASAPAAAPSATPRLVGFVLRPDGTPASGARVLLGQQQTRCSLEGRFELLWTPHRAGEDLLAFEPGYEPFVRPRYSASVAPEPGAELRLMLGAATQTLAGTVVDRAGSPVKGWTVELDEIDLLAESGLRERVRTDERGAFLITDVPVGIHVVRAWKERRELAFRSAPIGAGESGLTIVVDATD